MRTAIEFLAAVIASIVVFGLMFFISREDKSLHDDCLPPAMVEYDYIWEEYTCRRDR